jgi:acetyltransferase-like isoleucine patch superfamily enzyme
MLKYLLGILKNLFNPALSLFVEIDNKSHVDRNAKVYSHVHIASSTIGAYSYVGRNSRIVHADIGRFCSIASETKVGMGTHTLDKLSTSPIFTEKKNGTAHSWTCVSNVNPYKRVTVGNDVWIGVRVMIMGGVSIGDGAVIAAGSIVTKDIPPYSVAAGVPAKVIRYRFPQDVINRLEALKWWNLPDEVLKEHIHLFQQENIDVDVVEKLLKHNKSDS